MRLVLKSRRRPQPKNRKKKGIAPNAASRRKFANVSLHLGLSSTLKKVMRAYRANPSLVPEITEAMKLRHGWYRRELEKQAAS